MVKKRLSLIFVILLLVVSGGLSCLAGDRPDGMYGEMETSRGKILFRLFYEKTPLAVSNFMALAQGSNELVTTDRGKIPFYDGLTFHRVIPKTMVLAGDPKGTGSGGPGYRFKHEFRPDLRHDRAGILSMLNKGSFSHGSQFFITLRETPRFDDKHTIFGEVVQGQSVVHQLQEGDRIVSLAIIRQGQDAAAFDLSYHLKQLQQSARRAEAQARDLALKKTNKIQTPGKRKVLPKLTGKIDPARVPAENQPVNQKVALEYLLVSYKDALFNSSKPAHDKTQARNAARHLSQLAREEGADFSQLARSFSDSLEYEIPLQVRKEGVDQTLAPCFSLKIGQVTEPIDTLKGFMVFTRVALDLIEVRHILVSHKEAYESTHPRTREEARELAQDILDKANSGEDFAELARAYSDSDSARAGGLLGEIARGTTVPAFDQAAFSLGVNEISNITSSPAGFQIIKRIK